MASRRNLSLLSATLLVPLLVQAAGTKVGVIQVSVTIVGECTAVTPTALDFGANIGAGFTADVTAESEIRVNCAANTPYEIALNGGQNAGGSLIDRNMKLASGTAQLPYGLYTDDTRTTPWGDGTTGELVTGTADGSVTIHTVYGKLPPPSTSPQLGEYTDTVTVTLTY